MAHFDGAWLILEDNEAEAFLRGIDNPDSDVTRRRDEFFAELDQMNDIEYSDGSFEFEFLLEPEIEGITTAMQKALMPQKELCFRPSTPSQYMVGEHEDKETNSSEWILVAA